MGLHGTSWDFMGLHGTLQTLQFCVYRIPLPGIAIARIWVLSATFGNHWPSTIRNLVQDQGSNFDIRQEPCRVSTSITTFRKRKQYGTVWKTVLTCVNRHAVHVATLFSRCHNTQRNSRIAPKSATSTTQLKHHRQDLCFLQDNLEHLKNMQPTFRHMHVCVCVSEGVYVSNPEEYRIAHALRKVLALSRKK